MSAGAEPAVGELLASLAERYARGVDGRDTELFLGVFHQDAVLEVYNPSEAPGPATRRRGHNELQRVPAVIQRYSKTFHFIGNAHYEIGEGVATGQVYCIAHHLTPAPDGGRNDVWYIRYQDEYRQGADRQWRISHRKVLVDWTETRTVNPTNG